MIEDLVNQAPFDTFGRWLAERGSEWEGALVPVVQTGSSASQQVGSSTHCAALPPLLAYRHSPMGRDEARARVVCFCTTSGKGPRFTCTLDFSSAPFGGHIVQPLYYRLVEALGRPWCRSTSTTPPYWRLELVTWLGAMGLWSAQQHALGTPFADANIVGQRLPGPVSRCLSGTVPWPGWLLAASRYRCLHTHC